MSCSDTLCPCHDHNDERPLPSSDPVLETCIRTAKYFLDSDYETVPLEAVMWVAKRIRKGIEDDLEDLEAGGHITKAKVPF